MRDPYSILGVARNADQQAIKAAWRNAAKAMHPDQNPGDPEAVGRFTEVGRAYDLLKDPEKRKRYDEAQARAAARAGGEATFMERRAAQARAEAEARAAAQRMQQEAREAGQTAEDVVARIFGTRKAGGGASTGAAGATGTYGAEQRVYSEEDNGGYYQPEQTYRTGDQRGSPALDLIGYLIKRLTRQVPAPEKAPDLALDAFVSIEDLIGRINPTITLPDGKLLSITLPEDACDGSTVRVEGQGHRLPGMKRGDVLATLRLKPHRWYRVVGHDLYTSQPIDIENAVLGCETVVETPTGSIKVTVPEWSGSDHTIRIDGQGLPFGKDGRGALIVELRVMLWDRPDQKVIDLMRSLREGLFL